MEFVANFMFTNYTVSTEIEQSPEHFRFGVEISNNTQCINKLSSTDSSLSTTLFWSNYTYQCGLESIK